MPLRSKHQVHENKRRKVDVNLAVKEMRREHIRYKRFGLREREEP
jgi:hypothetical protein